MDIQGTRARRRPTRYHLTGRRPRTTVGMNIVKYANRSIPRRFQPRTTPAALRRRRQFLVRLGIVTAIILFGLFIWPGASILPVISLGLWSAGEDFQLETVRYYDLSNVQGTARGWEREERILLCAPLRDAESHLRMFFAHLRNFTYPHHLIDLAFLVSDSKDQTLPLLSQLLEELQADEDPKQPYGEISIIEKDFGQKVNQDVESRHGFAAQASRRKLMAQARNWLLSAALRPYHSWVYWRDVDVETAPFTILEDLMRHNKDVIVPSKYLIFIHYLYKKLTFCRRMAAPPRLAWRRTTLRFEFLARI
jgi:mannan polymerase II complex ANP1 subunit